MRVPCSVSSRAARSASVNTLASRQAAIRLRRSEVSAAFAASLVCMSRQKPQPLIWLARILTSSWVAAGSVESLTALPAELMCRSSLPASGLANRLRRASMVDSSVVACLVSGFRAVHSYDGCRRRDVTGGGATRL
ncbi:hypothetical protein SVIOM342S_06250 [Streptomyces violaceorubidus]